MIQSARTVGLVADRIERAYIRRYPDCQLAGTDGRVWDVAARALVEAQRRWRWLPLDPELFVASQAPRVGVADPWTELTPVDAVGRYRLRVLRIVKGLRAELRKELSRVAREVNSGQSLERILRGRRRWLSPLGRYIAAFQADRDDLVERYRTRAMHQHDSCPLYRYACARLLPTWAYPVTELVPGYAMTPRVIPAMHAVSLN